MSAAAFLSCVLLTSADAGTEAPPRASAPEEYAARLDELHARRDDAAVLKETEKVASEAVKAHPTDYGVLWRAARHYVWIADGEADDARKRTYATKAWNLGDKARARNPKGAEGQYYAAAGVGLWGEAYGVLKAISEGVDGKFNERLDKAIELDPYVDRAGPLLARARYYYVVPWPMRDLAKANEHLDQAGKKYPEHLRVQLYRADNLLHDGDAKKAKELVDRVLAGDESYDPPEAKRVKGLARKTLEAVEEELD